MKLNIMIPILSALLLGYLCASFVISEYNNSSLAVNSTVYFLQAGAYNSLESSKNDLTNIDNKITVKENDKYYSYIGITTSLEQAKRIKKLYKKDNVELYIKNVNLDNEDFFNELAQYDVLLENSKSLTEINSVLKTILASYEENIENY